MLTEYSWRTLGAYRHRFHTAQYAARNALFSAERAFSASPAALSARSRNDLIYSLQGLELLVTVLLARNRQPPPTVAAGVPHAELAAELITLPSGLLAMVGDAIVQLKVGCLCVLGGAWAYVCWEYCV